MRLGIVAEYSTELKNPLPAQTQHLVDYATQDFNIYVMNPSDIQSTVVRAFHARSSDETHVDIGLLDGIYFGCMFRALPGVDPHYFSSHIHRFTTMLETLDRYEHTHFVNPLETLRYGAAKDSLIEIAQRFDIPTIETEKVISLEHLVALSRQKGMIAKPTISERGKGVVLLDELSEDEIYAYGQRYLDNNARDDIAARQGIIVQPYMTDIGTYGERKIAVVDGEVTLSRIQIHPGAKIVNLSNGAELRRIEPTEEEKTIAYDAFYAFNQVYPAHFMRVDLVGPAGSVKVNEIEAINPGFCTTKGIFSPGEILNHYHKMFRPFKEPVKAMRKSA
jgi:glutathione synthase/RimK-type ligase-like ATP-grasp enzyme